MNNKMRMLLQLVGAKADIDFLLAQGLVYSQVSGLINEAVNLGWIHLSEEAIELTELGKRELNNRFYDGKGRWLSSDERYKITKTEIDTVYLPTKKESCFL